ncbi:hypothetical protein Rhopal_002447-T1 [Rhodotorula paludigena]|uniref:Shikimate dehydrogenase n=1 Tax=Rhodotorula paludigena TaxID=86838 RepID=A0AAV5GA27_9BASI|nr:hypothetical protein Rhopal_002447-T1 [Rhodotorula paludigena]
MPHKLKIREFLDGVTPVAELLGAVNTVIPVEQSNGSISLLGDNTDWIGLRDQVMASIEPNSPLQGKSGLVLGAGGAGRAAVYAMHQLGISPIYLYNRTTSRAEEIRSEFPADYGIQVLSSLDSRTLVDNAPTVVIGTLPASVTSTKAAPNKNGVFIPRQCVEQAKVVIDMAYLPRETPLIRLAHAMTADRPDSAIVVGTGLDVLLQQGFEQFRLWTGLEAPKEECRARVVAEYERENPL